MLSFRQIEAFRAVYVMRSMTRAADALHVSQPAISRLVRDMEAAVGLRLFRRRKGGLEPTEEAAALYAEIERSFVGIDRIQRAAARIRERHGGTIRVCAVAAFANSFLPAVVEKFLERHAGVGVALYTYDNDVAVAVELLRTRQFDIGYLMTPADRTGVEVDRVRRVRCVCVLPPGHRLAERSVVTIDDLRDEPFISLGEGTMTRLKIDAAFEAANVTRANAIEAYWSVSICSLVERGLGVSIIEPFTAENFAQRGGIVRPFEPVIDFSFVQVRQSRPVDPPLVTAFAGIFDETLATMGIE